jgi:diadenosine tetraphosphatase ApaH/serine/threonine PP2A family protein phosphatase
MIIALLADIHGNREALSACLADAERRKAERYVFLGDLVGYGADPGWVTDRAMDHTARGAIAVLGNHDAAATGSAVAMNDTATEAIAWTRARLSATQCDFLRGLPLTYENGEQLFVHASAEAPSQWPYILDARAARRSFDATRARLTFCGHVHVPALYFQSHTGKTSEFTPAPSVAIPLLSGRRWLAVLGAVGQPRDRNPAACYALLNEELNTLTFIRVPYDVETAARKIRENGLPAVLALRLQQGY